MKRKDGWILLAILALAFLCYLFFGRTGKETAKGTPMVRISAPGQETRLIPLDQEEMLTLEGENGARNSMAESNCRNQDCLRQGSVTAESAGLRPLGGKIICLPHQLVLELVFEDEESIRLEVTP